jgi:hypothetical protein
MISVIVIRKLHLKWIWKYLLTAPFNIGIFDIPTVFHSMVVLILPQYESLYDSPSRQEELNDIHMSPRSNNQQFFSGDDAV